MKTVLKREVDTTGRGETNQCSAAVYVPFLLMHFVSGGCNSDNKQIKVNWMSCDMHEEDSVYVSMTTLPTNTHICCFQIITVDPKLTLNLINLFFVLLS